MDKVPRTWGENRGRGEGGRDVELGSCSLVQLR